MCLLLQIDDAGITFGRLLYCIPFLRSDGKDGSLGSASADALLRQGL